MGGYNRKTLVLDKFDGIIPKHKVDEEQTTARVKELTQARNSTRYSRQKTALEMEFSVPVILIMPENFKLSFTR